MNYSEDLEASNARSIFVKNIYKAIGDLNDPLAPISIKPALQRLLLECDHYVIYGNESTFTKLCLDAIDVCGQGWTFLSCWISSSQNICYSIYWALKSALEKHQKASIDKSLHPTVKGRKSSARLHWAQS